MFAAECQRLRTECGRQKAQLEQECVARREQAEYHSQLTSSSSMSANATASVKRGIDNVNMTCNAKDELLADKAETKVSYAHLQRSPVSKRH